MTDIDGVDAGNDVLRQQSLDWLRLLTGGRATAADLSKLTRWREVSPEHNRAFAEATLMWELMGEVAAMVPAGDAAGVVAAGQVRPIRFGRRAFLVGGGALAASLAGAAIVHPPLGLWPSAAEMRAGYRTDRGERRLIGAAGAATVELNTQTSLDFHPTGQGGAAIDLISGEAAVSLGSSASEVLVTAGPVRTEARQGAFNVRRDGGLVCVTCIDGQVSVFAPGAGTLLRKGQQVAYSEGELHPVVSADPDVVGAWRHGLLVFRDAPLSDLVDEVNRYRPGRIILLDQDLARRHVVATFRLDRIEDAVTFVRHVMKVPARTLPGGIVLLG